METSSIKTATVLRATARYPLLVLGILVFLFALVSGSESYGGGIMGIIKNSPNAIPWVILLIFVVIAWKWELIGGILITLLGLGLFYFFNLSGPGLHWFPFILTLIIALLGSFFIVSWFLRKKAKALLGEKHAPKNQFLIYYTVVVVVCLIIAAIIAYSRNYIYYTPPQQTSILQPKEGSGVKQQMPAFGVFTQADSAKNLWLIVQAIDSTLYHPQPGPLQKTPQSTLWHATTYFGAPEDAQGQRYHLYLFAATEEASQVFRSYLLESEKQGQWPGLQSLPSGLTPLDTVTVSRKL